MRFGIMGFCTGPYEALAARVRFAERAGFDSAWFDDDIFTPSLCEHEPWTLLAALSRESSRIRLGTMVSVVPFRHPAFLALQAITVHRISGGRAQLGFGAGSWYNNSAALGFDLPPARELAGRMDEQAEILNHLLRGEGVDHQGPYYQSTVGSLFSPDDVASVPLIVAAHGERGMRTVAKYADGWNCSGGQTIGKSVDPDQRVSLTAAVKETKRMSERLDEICTDAGRDPTSIRRIVLAYRPRSDPLSSLAAFDDYVGRYEEIGIDEIVFYWPPLDNIHPIGVTSGSGSETEVAIPVSAAQQQSFERICAERIGGRMPLAS